MAATDYGPEIKSSMQNKFRVKPKRGVGGQGSPAKKNLVTSVRAKDSPAQAKAEGDTPAEMARDKARGIVEGSPRDEALDAKSVGMPPDAHHVAAAAGIAHAILGNRGMR
jgi:hypothetical protein